MSLNSTISKLEKITSEQKDEMFLLFNKYFINTNKNKFLDDMNEKDWIIIQRNNQKIVGFSTHKLIQLSVNNIERIFLFSGDTIVDKQYWLKSSLAGCFGHILLRLMKTYSNTHLYWFLISKGYRTYRFLPVYFKFFFPIFNTETPIEYANLIQAVATFKFNGNFKSQTGIISFGGLKDRLKSEMCKIPKSKINDPHVYFFLKKNPNYFLGDELACIADISKENLNEYAWRVINNAKVTWNE